jgi:N-methylhydantoinase B
VKVELDPVTLSVIQNGLTRVGSEMDLVHEKTSFSPVISESFDRSNGIYDAKTGEVIAQGELGLPIFVGIMQFRTQAVIEYRSDLEPGDVVLVNDPYMGGTHLMDVGMLRPFFYRDQLWCYLANTGHWPDTGGAVPGGFATRTTEIQQEGLRIPPVKLYERGVLNNDILSIVLHNIRVPEERIGDIKAQVGALTVGEERLTALLDRYGEETVRAAIAELKHRSELQMRAHIESVPDGTYSFSSFIDSDGIVQKPLEIHLELTVKGSDLHFDLSKSSPPCKGPMNAVWSVTRSALYMAIKHIFPDVPINSGCFVPLHIEKPIGTFLYAEYPRPVAGCSSEVAQRLTEVVFGAMGQAIPNRLFAAPAGTSGNFSLGGYDPIHKRRYVMYFFTGGGYGGWYGGDGLTNGCSAIGISKTQPVEVLEQHYPILFEEFSLREGSAGAGKNRGGFGVSYRTRILRGEAVASFLMDHGRFGPHGLLGGEPGAMNEIEVSQSGVISIPPHTSKGEGYELAVGDWVQVRSPGGGGYGQASERDPTLVERDVRREYLSPELAARQYPHLASRRCEIQTEPKAGDEEGQPN